MTNREKYDKIFMDVLNVKKSALGENFNFDDIQQWDSVAHLSLISELEEEFDIMFEAEDILNYGSYENGIKIMQKYGISI